jgi:Protein of unknown function (DUF3238)
MWAASDDGVHLSWGDVGGVSRYRISKDGEYLTTVEGTSYVDGDAAPGSEIQYVVQSVASRDASADMPTLTWGLTVSVPRATDLKAENGVAEIERLVAQAAQITETAIAHETFIPQRYISAPPVGCGQYNGSAYSFGGDNRGYAANDSRYRTRLAAVVDWANRGAVSWYKSVGSTTVYRTSDKAPLATRTASTENMSISRLALSNSSRADLRFTFQAGNPFCTSIPNAIEGAFTLTVTRSGNWFIMSGSHRQMPNHELYIARGGLAAERWTTAYRRDYVSPACLVGPILCEQADMTGFRGTY